MLRPLFAASLALTALACASDAPQPVVSGPPQTEPPEVLAAQAVRWPELPARPPRTTTTTAVLVPATAAPPVTTHVEEVRPLAESEPVAYSSIEQVIADAFGRYGSGVVDQAIRVARCESELKPTARNPRSGAAGLFQLMRQYHAEAFQRLTGVSFDAGWSDPYLNSLYAADLYGRKGWQPWVCKP